MRNLVYLPFLVSTKWKLLFKRWDLYRIRLVHVTYILLLVYKFNFFLLRCEDYFSNPDFSSGCYDDEGN